MPDYKYQFNLSNGFEFIEICNRGLLTRSQGPVKPLACQAQFERETLTLSKY